MEFVGGTSKSPAAQAAALRSCFTGRPPNVRQNLAPKTPRSRCRTPPIRRSRRSSWKANRAVLLDCRLLNILTMPAVQTAVLPGSQVDRSRRALLFGVALTSFSALLLELALTRLFSVVLFYHFAFLAISIALLGLGAGGVFAYLGKNWLARFETRRLVARLCNLNALIVPIVLVVVLRIPVSLELSKANFLRLTALYMASAVPFFVTGLEFSIVFARESANIPRLYGADLTGGALACLAIVPLLNWLGGPNTVLFAGLVMALAGGVWAVSVAVRKSAAGRVVFLLVLMAVNYSGRLFDIVYAKGGFRDAAWVEFARWNAISRVEVDHQGNAKAIVIDADASTAIMNSDPKQWQDSEWRKDLMSAPPALAHVLRPPGR